MAPSRRPSGDVSDPEALVEELLLQGRYALVLRPQIAATLSEEQHTRARQALEENMALVPDGEVVLGVPDDLLGEGEVDDDTIRAAQGRVVRVNHFFLDRFPVTNRQYQEFVAAGGYEQISLWDETIWPAVLQFVDATGLPGPAFWRNGTAEAGRESHPVVGVCWYEAAAYARWVGKRLPSDAEWVKAASWPVRLSETTRVQRRYPWGDHMDRRRANLWGSGPSGTAAVADFADGVSVGGVYQMVGNVWEWTRGDFRGEPRDGAHWVFDVPLKSIRGGAYDTYFDNQATCHFQSGEVPLARKHNIGFRCGVGICDVLLVRPSGDESEYAEDLAAAVAEAGS
jgi:iron(II)-dependent oxidoreductase